MQLFSCQIEEMQFLGIHEELNAQGFAMHYRAIFNRVAISKFFFYVRGSFTLVCLEKEKLLSQTW